MSTNQTQNQNSLDMHAWEANLKCHHRGLYPIASHLIPTKPSGKWCLSWKANTNFKWLWKLTSQRGWCTQILLLQEKPLDRKGQVHEGATVRAPGYGGALRVQHLWCQNTALLSWSSLLRAKLLQATSKVIPSLQPAASPEMGAHPPKIPAQARFGIQGPKPTFHEKGDTHDRELGKKQTSSSLHFLLPLLQAALQFTAQ